MQWLVIRGTDGLVLPPGAHALTGPRRRVWHGVRLVSDVAVPASRTADGWAFAGDAEVDVLVGPEPVAPASLTVLGSFARLDLASFLVGGQVLDTTSFGGARCPSEQTALQLWRLARWQGGAFWLGVADVVEAWVRQRVAAGLVHDLLVSGETHTRFVADAVLLLAAVGTDATAALEPLRAGDWFRHDSLDPGDRVLNTHVLALVARQAAGAPAVGVASLHAALVPAAGPRAWAHAVDLLAGDLAASVVRGGLGHTHAAEMRAARQRHRDSTLVLPLGRTGRDTRASVAPAYHTVNVADLASFACATGDPVARRAALAGARYALASGHWRALRRDGSPIVTVVPAALLRLGLARQADRWAAALVSDGWAPALGWPGFVDAPWERLPAGAL